MDLICLIVSAVVLPFARQEFVESDVQCSGDAGTHVGEARLGIDTAELDEKARRAVCWHMAPTY